MLHGCGAFLNYNIGNLLILMKNMWWHIKCIMSAHKVDLYFKTYPSGEPGNVLKYQECFLEALNSFMRHE